MASLLCTKVDFRKVVLATIVAVIHVGILVLSRDLGSAVIFFVTYLVLIYVATRNPSYLFLGLGGGCFGSVIAYHLFGHVQKDDMRSPNQSILRQVPEINSSDFWLPHRSVQGR